MKANKPFLFLRAEPEFANRSFSKEAEDLIRTKFDRDRDRILFSKEYRRLQGKTQVFITGFDDHIRNRLTHTIEVAQISQTISKYFGFNDTLAEAISLGHDVGHTPFGHVGERVLNFLTNNCDKFKDFLINKPHSKGFKHNWQGLKVVSTLEKINPNYKGLNLTDYTLWGILNHSSLEYKKCTYSSYGKCNYRHNDVPCHIKEQKFLLNYYNKYNRLFNSNSWSFEGLIVNISDEIAQRHHDIEDGLYAGIIDRKELVDTFYDFFSDYLDSKQKSRLTTISNSKNQNYVIHDLSSLILGFYSINLISNTEVMLKGLLDKYQFRNEFDFYNLKSKISDNEDIFKIINFENDFNEKDKLFQKYLYSRVLNSHIAESMDGKASYILRNIIQAYLTNPKQLPDSTIITLFSNYYSEKEFKEISHNKSQKFLTGILRDELGKLHSENNNEHYTEILIRTITDFIAGMTDDFALNQYRMLYGSNKLKNY